MKTVDALLLQGQAPSASGASAAQALPHGWSVQSAWAQDTGGAYVYLTLPERCTMDEEQRIEQAALCQQAFPALKNQRLSRLELIRDMPGQAQGQSAPAHYVVEMNPEPGWWPELVQWYDVEHMPGLAGVPGTVRARRYLNHDHGPLSLACYDLAATTVLNSPPWLLVRNTPWSDRMRPRFMDTKRTLFATVSTPAP